VPTDWVLLFGGAGEAWSSRELVIGVLKDSVDGSFGYLSCYVG